MPRIQLQNHNSPRQRMAGNSHLPIYNPVSGDVSRSRSMENRVHLIPIIVLLCIFILWVSSSNQVDITFKDGKFDAVDEINKPEGIINETGVDLAMLALVTTPSNASAPQQLIPERHEIGQQPGAWN